MLYEVRNVSDVPRSLQSCVQPFKRSYSQLTFFNFIKVYTGTTVVPGILYAKILFFFFHHIYYLRPSTCILSLLVGTQMIQGHIASSSPPLPTTVRAFHFFIAKIFQLFLPSSTRVELCLPTLGALSSS